MLYTQFDTKLCKITLVGDDEGLAMLHLHTGEGKRTFSIDDTWERRPSFFKNEQTQIKEYMSGKRKTFAVRINPHGTVFQKKVWKALQRIPYGAVCSYKDIAKRIGNEHASRAVGMANSRNPIPLIVPCHRVVGARGALVGFAHGLSIKKRLLTLEQAATQA